MDRKANIQLSKLPRAMMQDTESAVSKEHGRGTHFWIIMGTISVLAILPGLETTVITTSMASITADLNLGKDYIWVSNAMFLTSTAVQPLFGQAANIFGRRPVALLIVVVYILGSGICGAAINGATLIAGRAVQGIGIGGLNLIGNVIISDLVPLRKRGKYLAISLSASSIGISVGPLVGGALVQRSTWRWIFYMNLPIGGTALILLSVFLNVEGKKATSIGDGMRSFDYGGTLIIVASSLFALSALTYGGVTYPWSDPHVLVPLIFGCTGLLGFYIFEQYVELREPVMPRDLLKSQTTIALLMVTFLSSLLLYWTTYFLALFYQGLRTRTPEQAGIDMMPLVLITIPSAAISIVALGKFGRYRLIHMIGCAICTIGMGLFAMLNQESELVETTLFQLVAGLGSGMIVNTILPALQASFPESEQALVTAAWTFVRNFAKVWGVAIPGAIFNSRCAALASNVIVPDVRNALKDGQAYEHTTAAFVEGLPQSVRLEVISIYATSLRLVWHVAIVFSGLAFIFALCEKEIPLEDRSETESDITEI